MAGIIGLDHVDGPSGLSRYSPWDRRSALPGGGLPRGSLSWSDEANFGLGWGLVGPTGGSDSGEGREPLLPSAVGP